MIFPAFNPSGDINPDHIVGHGETVGYAPQNPLTPHPSRRPPDPTPPWLTCRFGGQNPRLSRVPARRQQFAAVRRDRESWFAANVCPRTSLPQKSEEQVAVPPNPIPCPTSPTRLSRGFLPSRLKAPTRCHSSHGPGYFSDVNAGQRLAFRDRPSLKGLEQITIPSQAQRPAWREAPSGAAPLELVHNPKGRNSSP